MNESLALIDSINTNAITSTMTKIRSFQQIVQQTLVPGKDFGIIPGTDKPTMLKPGAEKILMLLGLSSSFEIMSCVEQFDSGFFSYNVRCTLFRDCLKITEGVGHCNSRENKYVKSDPYSIANTILKMARKRALVDASLTVASLSDLFTQDVEDMDHLKIQPSGPSHRDNQGKSALEIVVTFGKHKGRTMGDLIQNERQYVEWLAGSDNQKWAPVAKQALAAAEAPRKSNAEIAEYEEVPVEVMIGEEPR